MTKEEFLQVVLRLSSKHFITYIVIDNLGYLYCLDFEGRPASILELDKNILFKKQYLFNGKIGYSVELKVKM